MYAPVVTRFRSISVDLEDHATQYCDTVNLDSSVRRWIQLALKESHRVDQDELDWPAEPVIEI